MELWVSSLLVSLNYLGIAVFLIFGSTWRAVGLLRRKKVDEIRQCEDRDNNPFAFMSTDINDFRHSTQIQLPMVSVVMPVKGVHEKSLSNWRTQCTSLYGGPIEYVFVVESEEDPAYEVISKLIDEFAHVKIKLAVAGITFHNGQKVHNQLEGIMQCSSSSEFVFFLDDDIQLHPGTILSLVKSLQNDASVLIATGHPVDLPDPTGNFISYLMSSFRLTTLNGYMHEKTFFVWGGCMMMRKEDLWRNRYGIIDALRDGGYSDDMVLTAIANQAQRKIASPSGAIFPDGIPARNFEAYRNFISRQLFTSFTYCNAYHRVLNVMLFLAPVLGGLVAFLPSVGLVAQASHAAFSISWHGAAALALPDFAHEYQIHQVLTALAFSATLIYAYYGMKGMFDDVQDMCRTLSPNAEHPMDVRSVNMRLLFLAFILHSGFIFFLGLNMLTKDTIIWSRVRYTIKRGRVVRVSRIAKFGNEISMPREYSLDSTVKRDLTRNFPYGGLKEANNAVNSAFPGLRKLSNASSSTAPPLLRGLWNKSKLT